MMYNGVRFITFEGGEGAGKTTLIHYLEHELRSRGISTVKTREPGGTPFGDQVRRWLLEHREGIRIDAKAELLLFLAARAQHIEEVIAPAVESGKVVLCDRFNDSTIAYQGAARGLGVPWVQSLCSIVCGSVQPTLTFYLDVDPQIGLKRTRSVGKQEAPSGQYDRIESETLVFHQRVRDAFLAIAKAEPQRVIVIDANRPQEEVMREALCFLI